jgi:Zn-dependent metalloprotease
MGNRCSINCIVPPHVLHKMLESTDAEIRDIALATLLASSRMRGERRLVGSIALAGATAGEKRRTIFDCRHGQQAVKAKLVRGEGAPETHDASVTRAYDGLGATYDFYSKVLGRNSVDDRGMRLDGYVHYGTSYNNAFWDGRRMIFGDGDGRVFSDFTGSLDVIAHELTHGVTEFTAGLEYHTQSGALNESMSDVFGCVIKQWVLKQRVDQADWLIGADIYTPGIKGDALRSMKAPGHAYDDPVIGRDPQPAHMRDFANLPDTDEGDWGGVHINSGIPNHAFYVVATELGGNAWDAPAHIWYESLKAMGRTATFEMFASRTAESAARLYGTASAQQQAVRTAWDTVGVRIAAEGARGRAPAHAADDASDSQEKLLIEIQALVKKTERLSKDVEELKRGMPPRRVAPAAAR